MWHTRVAFVAPRNARPARDLLVESRPERHLTFAIIEHLVCVSGGNLPPRDRHLLRVVSALQLEVIIILVERNGPLIQEPLGSQNSLKNHLELRVEDECHAC